MKNKNVKLLTLLLVGVGLTNTKAQEATITTGGNAFGSSGSVNYSVGQIVYKTKVGSNGSVSEGAQQTFEIMVLTAVESAKGISLQCSAYPNPTTDFLQLKLDDSMKFKIQSISYELYDNNGKQLISESINSTETNIIMTSFISSTYFLKVIQKNKLIKSFKIIKK